MEQWAIGIDIGGTRVSIGAVSAAGQVIHHEHQPAPQKADDVIALLMDMTGELFSDPARKATACRGIGIGFGGPVDFSRQAIIRSHHVAGWAPGMPLGELFARRFAMRVVIDNDANAAALGEALYGAGRGRESMLYVNVGTGIGGALVIGGDVRRGAHSAAGEVGHTVVLPDGPSCTCGKKGCLETLASGTAIARMGKEAGLGAAISGREVMQLAAQGESRARIIVHEAAGWLGLGLGNAAMVIDPEIVVVGGGVAGAGEMLLEPLRAAFAKAVMPAARKTPVVAAELGYEAGIIGAAALVLASDRQ